MKTYIITLLLSTTLALIASFFNKKKNKTLCVIFLILSAIPPIMTAAMRSLSIGRDIETYLLRLMSERILTPNLIDYIAHSDTDPLFALIVYIGYANRNAPILLGLIQLATILPIIIFAYKKRNSINIGMVMLVYITTSYCASLSMMRQSIAISIIILAYAFYREKKTKKAIALYLLAICAHSTAFVAIALVPFKLINDMPNTKRKYLYTFLVVAAISLAAISLDKIVAHTSYAYHLGRESALKDISLLSIAKRVIWLIPIALSKYTKNKTMNFELIVISTILSIISFRLSGAGRLSLYFMNLAYYTMIPTISHLLKSERMSLILYSIALLLLWIHMTAVKNDTSEVYPYKSEILNINESIYE